MWKVKNNINKGFLDRYNTKIIEPIFDFIIALKEKSYSSTDYSDFESEIDGHLDKDFPKIIFKKKYKSIECFGLILSLLKTQTLDDLKKQKEIFVQQNISINAGNYSLNSEKVPNELYRIFSNIFYTECFDDDDCWEFIESGLKFKRTDFHNNFKSENEDRTICSLCDIDTVIVKSNGIVEHFLPRKEFPYLSMNANNLTVACNACNLKEEGKGSDVINPITSPFSKQIGDEIKFDIKNLKIDLTPIRSDQAIVNYIGLLKLNNRFASKSVYNSAINKLNSEISTHNQFSKYASTEELFSLLIENLEKRKDEGFYFLKRNYFGENYKEYLEELKTI